MNKSEVQPKSSFNKFAVLADLTICVIMLPGDFVRVSQMRDSWLLREGGISHV
jgi:hypothetical protein